MIHHSVLRSATCAVLVFLAAGLAACLVCDLGGCCDETCQEDSSDCACGCIIHGTLGMSAPRVSTPQDDGFEVVAVAPRILSTHPQPLFRPPRA